MYIIHIKNSIQAAQMETKIIFKVKFLKIKIGLFIGKQNNKHDLF